ncbi:MAG: hypothetical protein HA494_05715 [Thaumarchaeota archaeon]|nr:hypothetical protein [Nitrososphaerota archaeon]
MAQTLKKNRLNADHNVASTTRHNSRIGVDVQSALDKELVRMKGIFKTGYEIHSVKWIPNDEYEKEGEVKDNTIYVYSSNERDALKTLRHEFFHYLISKPAKKYEKIVNVQGALIRSLLAQLLEEAYREEEQLVDKLVEAFERMSAESKESEAP